MQEANLRKQEESVKKQEEERRGKEGERVGEGGKGRGGEVGGEEMDTTHLSTAATVSGLQCNHCGSHLSPVYSSHCVRSAV